MQESKTEAPNPQDLSLHKQLKEISDLLTPELLRLHKMCEGVSGNSKLYEQFISHIRTVKKEVSNHDTLCALHDIIHHMQKAIDLTEKKMKNHDILMHLQEVKSLLFKVQNLPS